MRAPSRSFRAALATYRQQIVTDNEGHPQLPLWLNVLDNWARHKSVEKIWLTIKEKMPAEFMLTEEELIWLVLDQRLNVLEPLSRIVDELPKVEKQVDHRTKRHLKERKRTQIATENALLQTVLDGSERLLGREKKTAIRNRFILGWTDRFVQNCGQPLDDVVKGLTEIAFGKAITVDAVRGARKNRPQADRDTAPQI